MHAARSLLAVRGRQVLCGRGGGEGAIRKGFKNSDIRVVVILIIIIIIIIITSSPCPEKTTQDNNSTNSKLFFPKMKYVQAFLNAEFKQNKKLKFGRQNSKT